MQYNTRKLMVPHTMRDFLDDSDKFSALRTLVFGELGAPILRHC